MGLVCQLVPSQVALEKPAVPAVIQNGHEVSVVTAYVSTSVTWCVAITAAYRSADDL